MGRWGLRACRCASCGLRGILRCLGYRAPGGGQDTGSTRGILSLRGAGCQWTMLSALGLRISLGMGLWRVRTVWGRGYGAGGAFLGTGQLGTIRGRGPGAEREAPPQLSCSGGRRSSLGVWPKLLGASPDGGALTKARRLMVTYLHPCSRKPGHCSLQELQGWPRSGSSASGG